MLSPAELYTEHERLALANLQSTLRYSAFAHDAFASLAVVQLVSGTLATGATLGLFVYEYLSAGPQRLLLLSLLRLSLLLCAGLVAFKAFGQRAHSFLGLPRPALYRVAVYLQLLWFALELLLGSALLVFVPLLSGTELSPDVVVDSDSSWSSSLLVKSLPVFYMVGMAGCLCFLTQIRNRRRFKDGRAPLSPASYSLYDSESVKCPSRFVSSSGRDPPPAVTCEIVLMEHQLDTNESVLFVHKKLRPIKTRPDDARPGTNYLPLLKPLIHSGGKSIAPQQQPAQHLPQQQQAHRQPPPPPQQQQAPNLICLSSTSTTTTAATSASRVQRSGGSSTSSGGGSQASFTSPVQRLQQLASGGVVHQQQAQQQAQAQGSFSFASTRDYVPGLAPHHLSSCAGSSASSGARSIAGLA